MSVPLPDDFRRALRMEGEPTIVEGLARAEERLAQVINQLEKLPDFDPARASLKREHDSLQGILQELRDTVHGVTVDELCDAAEEALAEKPTRRAKARELLKQARREGKPLPADSVYLRRVQQLEGRLDDAPVTSSRRTPTDLGADATIAAQKTAASDADKKTAGDTPIAPISETDSAGTGGSPSTIPKGINAGMKVGGGRFTLVRELGRGGMGVVWLATDGLLKRDVAVKLLPPEVAADELALNDLRRETVESQRLSHPHIMRIHDLYQTPGEPAFISMEYVDGPNLRSLLGKQSQRCFSWDTLRPFMNQLASALDYAHGERVIHRDLKPSNLMLDSKNRLKLADFGIAATMSDSMSRVSRHDKDKDTSGTLNYMSPQQMRGDNPSTADDMYSLGATLYELLTSRTPFYRGDIQYQVKNEIPQTPAERLADLGITNEIPERVSAMVMACLAKDPKARPESATWMAQQMEGTTRSARAVPPAPATTPAAAVELPPAPPTAPTRPTAGTNPAPVTAKTSVAPASVPTQPRTESAAPVEKKGKGVLIGVIVVLILGLVGFFALHHKSSAPGTIAEAPTNTAPPAPVLSFIQLTAPAGAEVLSNDVSLGKADGPMRITGTPGDSFKLEVRQDGFATQTKTVNFPEAGKSMDQAITLVSMPATLLITCDPLPTEIVLTREGGKPQSYGYDSAGLKIDAGVAYEVAITIPERDTVHRRINPLSANQRYPLDIPKLTEPSGSLRVSVDPPGTRFSLVYPGHPAVAVGTNAAITDVKPRVKFQLVAERKGYITVTKELLVKPSEILDVDLGRLVMQTADLVVYATPRPYQLTITYDGIPHSYGTSGKASSIPAGRKIEVTVSLESDSGVGATTNVTLEPGDNTINFGALTAPMGYLVVKSSPDGAEVSYAVSGQRMSRPAVMDRIENLPLGKDITVTVRKAGYEEKTLHKKLERSGETLDFTRLTAVKAVTAPTPALQPAPTPTPVKEAPKTSWWSHTGTASIKVYGPNDDADIYVNGQLSGIKNNGVISNLVGGRTYEIKLHRMGFEDLMANVTMNADSSEKFEMFPEARPTTKILDADMDAKLAEIQTIMNDVKQHIPFDDTYRRQMNDWIDKTERTYKRNSAVMDRIKQPLRDLKELVNARSSRARR